MQKIVSLLDDFLKIIAASSVLLIIAGFIDLKLYYGNFGINISDYITTSEILLPSIDKLALVFFSLLIQVLIWLSLFDYLFDYSLEESMMDSERRPKEGHNETLHRFFKSKIVRVYGITLVAGFLVSIALGSIFPTSRFCQFLKDFFIVNYWIGMCLYMAWILSAKSLWDSFKSRNQYNAKFLTTGIVFLTVLFASIWAKNSILSTRIYKHGNTKNIELIFEDNFIVTQTDTIRYIGNTENYFFFWNKVTGHTDVYPQKDLKKIVIR